MEKPFWRVNFDHARYGLTGFRIQSAICFVTILSLGFLLRLSTIAWGVAARCIEADQFWFEPYKSDWPLGGMFFLIFFLLLIWNASILLDQVVRRKRDLFLSAVNFVAIVGLFALASPAFDTAKLRYGIRESSFGSWVIPNAGGFLLVEDQCILATPYVGRWKVVELDLPKYGLEFPALWIELSQTLELEAADSRWAPTYHGDWHPPSFRRNISEDYKGVGELYWDRQWSVWVFELDDDTLTLATPDVIDWQAPAKVVLRKDPAE